MRKLPLVIGLAIGYVLGARAGRERYEQIRERASRLWESPRVRKARREVESYARKQGPVILSRAEAAAKAAPGVISDGARVTAATAKSVVDKSAAVAIDVADRATTMAKDVSQTVTHTAKDVAGKTATTATDVVGKAATAATDVAGKAAEVARDVASKTATGVRGVARRVTDTADDVKDRVTATASGVRERGEEVGVKIVAKASNARDDALANVDDDENEN